MNYELYIFPVLAVSVFTKVKNIINILILHLWGTQLLVD